MKKNDYIKIKLEAHTGLREQDYSNIEYKLKTVNVKSKRCGDTR